MATPRRFNSLFNALTAIVLLLLPVCSAQLSGSSTDNSDTISQSSSGFGYELLRSQLDEMQASILQLQQIAERRNECAGLENSIAIVLNRLKTIEERFKATAPAPSVPVNSPAATFPEERFQNIVGNVLDSKIYNMLQIQKQLDSSSTPVQETTPQPSIYERVYDSCDDVPFAGLWRIRKGIQILNYQCYRF